jgi:hypothetical protein
MIFGLLAVVAVCVFFPQEIKTAKSKANVLIVHFFCDKIVVIISCL